MANETGKRRLSVIAAHLAPADDVSATHLQPLNCSTYITSVIRRCDNRVYFARQGSESQGAFMRQASIEGDNSTRSSAPLKSSIAAPEAFFDGSEGPLYSRPATELRPNFNYTASEPPLFARPSCGFIEPSQFISETKLPSSGSNGTGWSPRMDVAESGRSYVLTVEIPGVKISDIRVEVDDRKLTVTGKRSIQYHEVARYSKDSVCSYQKKEILEGPYQVFWPLPIDINKDGVVAEFWDGLLRIILPKL